MGSTEILGHATGALYGLAIGDALGMPTQSLRPAEIRASYGHITGFVDAAPTQPIAPSMRAGSITDDTEQALILARLLIEGRGSIDQQCFATELMQWEEAMRRRGSLDLLGPSTKAALERLRAGAPAHEAGRFGTTNGAAMRITPVGIAFQPGPALTEAVVQASLVTHNTGLGLSAAGAVGTAVSVGIQTGDLERALQAGVAAAGTLENRGSWVEGASIRARVERFRPMTASLDLPELSDFLREVVGTSVQSQESVVSALLLAGRTDLDPFEALCLAASLGGDTDTIAAMTGAILGAAYGADAFPLKARETVREVNGLELEDLAQELLNVRQAQSGVIPKEEDSRQEPVTGEDLRSASTARLIHTGEAIADLTMRVQTFPSPGADTFADSYEVFAGGGTNVMAAAARQGIPVVYAGAHGTGPYGDVVRRALAAEGVEMVSAPVAQLDTGFCIAVTDSSAERTFITTTGAESQNSLDILRGAWGGAGDLVYVCGYSFMYPDNAVALREYLPTLAPVGGTGSAGAAPVSVFVDPSPVIDVLEWGDVELLMRHATVWSTNEREARILRERWCHEHGEAAPHQNSEQGQQRATESPEELCAWLAQTLGCAVVLRVGAQGCLVSEGAGGVVAMIPAPAVQAVDTNGAGDAHAGVMCARLAAGESLAEAARWANAAAAIAVTRFGPATCPTLEELMEAGVSAGTSD